MKRSRNISRLLLLFILGFLGPGVSAHAQKEPDKLKIAIFAPLYLDSAFDGALNYRYGKTFPKFINPGLEFYEGAQLALDSLQKENAQLEVFVFDTRADGKSIETAFKDTTLEGVDLVIAHASSNEIRAFADFAAVKKIPFINVNLPNDGGVNNNPFMVMLNPTLRTHCEGIYRYLQKYYALEPIIMFRKKGVQEDLVKSYFEEYSKVTASVPLKIKYVDLEPGFTVDQLASHLDSNRKSVIIAGSLDINFGRNLAQLLAPISPTYSLTIMGMPTWDGIRDFDSPEYKGLEVFYSTPFYNSRTNKVSQDIINYFNLYMFARPSDMVFRGYEATWRFSKLLLDHKNDLASNLTRKEYNVFREFDIQPVFLNRQSPTLDYFENKKLFFVKMVDGVITGVY